VPGANKALDKLCKEWGDKNKVDVHIDYITSQGEKDKLTAAAEAQAGTGHDIMSHRDWNIRIHQAMLEPLDDVIAALIQKYGPISPVAEYLAKSKGVWLGVPTAVGSQVKPCCSRFDLYKEHAGIDMRDMFPSDESKWDKAKVDSWTWDAYVTAAQKLHKAASRSAADGPDLGRGRLGRRSVQRLRRVFIDAKDNIKINSDQTRRRWKSPARSWKRARRSVRLGRRRQQPLADLGQGLGHHEPAERLGGRQARQSEGGGAMLDASGAEGSERPLRRPASAVLRPVEVLQEQAGCQGSSALHLAKGIGGAVGRGFERL
jgi:hypothetical protein